MTTPQCEASTNASPPSSASPSRENAELALGSLAALLSSAQTNGRQHPVLSSSQPALAMFLSPLANSEDGSKGGTLFAPSLSIRGAVSSAKSSELSLQDATALHLAMPVSGGPETVGNIPVTMRENIGESFLGLVDSRIRSSMGLLVQQSVKLGSVSEAMTLTKLLTRKPVEVTTIVTSLRVLSTAGAGDKAKDCAGGSSATFEQEEGGSLSATLPLTFEAVVDANVLGKMTTVIVTAPGTVRGTFHPTDGLFSRVEIALDTVALLASMIKEARNVAKRTVRRAAQVAAAVKAKEQKKLAALETFHQAAAAQQQLQQEQQQQQQQQQLQQQLQLPINFLRAAASFGSLNSIPDQFNKQQPAPTAPQQSEDEVKAARSLLDSTSGLPEHMLKTMAEISNEKEVQQRDRKRRRRRKKGEDEHEDKSTSTDAGSGVEGDGEDDRAQPMTLSSMLAMHEQVRQEEEEKNRQTAAAALVSSCLGSDNRPSPGGGASKVGAAATDQEQGGGQGQQPLFAWLEGSDILLKEKEGDGDGQQQQQQQQVNRNESQNSLESQNSNSLGVPQAYTGGRLPHKLSSLFSASQDSSLKSLPSKKRIAKGFERKVSFNMKNETFECV